MDDSPVCETPAEDYRCPLRCPAMLLMIIMLIVGAVLAFHAGERQQALRQSRADAVDSRHKAFKAWRAQWTALGAAVIAWTLLGLAVLLAAIMANR